MKTILTGLLVLLIVIPGLSVNVTVSGPAAACDASPAGTSGHPIYATGGSFFPIQGYRWECTNCELLYGGTWETTKVGSTQFGGNPGMMGMRILNNATTVSVKVTWYTQWSEASDTWSLNIGAPNSSAGTVFFSSSTLQNCSNEQVVVDINSTNGWTLSTWSMGSGMEFVNWVTPTLPRTDYSAYVRSTEPTGTGSRSVTAISYWTDLTGATCGSKTTTGYIQLTGPISSNEIGLDVFSYASGPNTICDQANEGENILTVDYYNGEADSWQWNFPSNWTYSSSSTSGNAYTVTSAGSSGYVSIKATNECGTTSWRSFYVNVESCEGDGEELMIVPNPSESGFVSLLTKESASELSSSKLKVMKFTIHIYKGLNLQKTSLNVGLNDPISTKDLGSGIYIFKIVGANQIVERRVIIK